VAADERRGLLRDPVVIANQRARRLNEPPSRQTHAQTFSVAPRAGVAKEPPAPTERSAAEGLELRGIGQTDKIGAEHRLAGRTRHRPQRLSSVDLERTARRRWRADDLTAVL
jgi:hypothetical protein